MKLPRARSTVRRLMLAVALAASLLGLIMMSFRSRRMIERRGREGACYSSLNNIAVALHNYTEANGRFPPPFEVDEQGDRKHSWRPLILRWFPVDYPQAGSYDVGTRWDGIGNTRLSSEVPGFLRCPSVRVENPHGSPFVMINDLGDTDLDKIPDDAILVLEAWGANRNWLDPRDRVEMDPRIRVQETDHPRGFGVILRDFSVVRVRDAGSIRKRGRYYVLER